MANVLTGLIPTIYTAADIVAREQVGMIPAAYINADVTGAALNATISYNVVPSVSISTITPAATAPISGSQTIGVGTMTISSAKSATFLWNGEEERSVGANLGSIKNNQWAQAFRSLTNAIEADAVLEAVNNSSRQYGTAGTTPFATAGDMTDIAQINKILDDNGAPKADRHIVYNTVASAKLRGTQSALFKVNEAGTDSMLRGGTLGSLFGFEQHESNQFTTHNKGSGTSYTTNTTGFAVGTTSIPLITGSGTILAGDTITFAGDTNKYTVVTGISGPGNVVIAEPGLRVALPASAVAVTVGNNYTPSVALVRDGLHIVARTPIMPQFDAALDQTIITDPYSGLSYLVAVYGQYHQTVIEVGAAWGVKAVKRDFITTLLG